MIIYDFTEKIPFLQVPTITIPTVLLKFLQYEEFFAFVSVEAIKKHEKVNCSQRKLFKGRCIALARRLKYLPGIFLLFKLTGFLDFHKKQPSSFLRGQDTYNGEAKNSKIYLNFCNKKNSCVCN